MDSSDNYSNNKYAYVIICLAIIAFNLRAIWGFDGLLEDDQMHYYLLSSGHYDWGIMKRVLFAPIFLYYIHQLFLISVLWSRLAVVLFFMLPCSSVLFYLFRNIFRIPFIISVSAAIFPFILPGQNNIPTYCTGSYFFPALLFGLLALTFGLNYFITQKARTVYLSASVICYFLAIECSELFALMIPVYLFAFFAYRKFIWKNIYPVIFFVLLSSYKIITTLINPWGGKNSAANHILPETIINRLKHSFYYMNPFGLNKNSFWIYLLLIIFIIAGIYLNFKTPERLFTGEKDKVSHPFSSCSKMVWSIYAFAVLWTVCSMVPFIFLSQDFSSRYLFIASIGLNLILCLSFFPVFQMISVKKINGAAIIFTGLLIFAGINRDMALEKQFGPLNQKFQNTRSYIKKVQLPKNAQLILTSKNNYFEYLGAGVFYKSSGSLRHMLGRSDISGQIMFENNYYDPFLITGNAWMNRNSELNISYPSFLFRTNAFAKDDYSRLEYVLQWKDKNSMNSDWTIYKLDKNSGKTSGFIKGTGWTEYNKSIDSLKNTGISRDMIMFGGIPSQQDSIRLKLKR